MTKAGGWSTTRFFCLFLCDIVQVILVIVLVLRKSQHACIIILWVISTIIAVRNIQDINLTTASTCIPKHLIFLLFLTRWVCLRAICPLLWISLLSVIVLHSSIFIHFKLLVKFGQFLLVRAKGVPTAPEQPIVVLMVCGGFHRIGNKRWRDDHWLGVLIFGGGSFSLVFLLCFDEHCDETLV